MGEVSNGHLRALLIQSRSSLPSLAREMADKGMISEETMARLQQARLPNGTAAGAEASTT